MLSKITEAWTPLLLQLDSLHEEMVSLRKRLDESAEQLARTKRLLDDKEDDLRALRADSRRRLADVYEMK